MSQNPSDEQPVETLIQYHGLDDFTDSLHRKPGYVPSAVNLIDEQIGDANRRQGRDLERLVNGAILNIFQFNFSDGTDGLIVNGDFDFTQNNRTLTQSNAAGPYPLLPRTPLFAYPSTLPDFQGFFKELSLREKYVNGGTDAINLNVAIRDQQWGIDVYDRRGEDNAGKPILVSIAANVRDKNAILNYKAEGYVLRKNKGYPAVPAPSDLSTMPADFYWVDYLCDSNNILLDLQTINYIYNFVLSQYIKDVDLTSVAVGAISYYASWDGIGHVPSGADSYQPGGYSFSDENWDYYWVNIQSKILGLISSKMRRAGYALTETAADGKYVVFALIGGGPMDQATYESLFSTYIGSIPNNGHFWSVKSNGAITDNGAATFIAYADNYEVDANNPEVEIRGFTLSTDAAFSNLAQFKYLTADWYVGYDGSSNMPSAFFARGQAGYYGLWEGGAPISQTSKTISSDTITEWVRTSVNGGTMGVTNEIAPILGGIVIVNCPPLPISPDPSIQGPTVETFLTPNDPVSISSTETAITWGFIALGRGAANRSTYQGVDGQTIAINSSTMSFAPNPYFNEAPKTCVLAVLNLGLQTVTGSPSTVTISLYINGTLISQNTVAYANVIQNVGYCFSIYGYGNFGTIRPPQNNRNSNYDGWTSPVSVQVKLTLDSGTALASATFTDYLVNYGF